jgi:hypothetical protein
MQTLMCSLILTRLLRLTLADADTLVDTETVTDDYDHDNAVALTYALADADKLAN